MTFAFFECGRKWWAVGEPLPEAAHENDPRGPTFYAEEKGFKPGEANLERFQWYVAEIPAGCMM